VKKYGDAVVYSKQGVSSNALVQQSKVVDGKELLTLVLLDPKLEGQLMTGQLANKSVVTVFDVPPVDAGAGHGWLTLTSFPEAAVRSFRLTLPPDSSTELPAGIGPAYVELYADDVQKLYTDHEQVKKERQSWEETAAQFSRNADYYRGLVVEIGENFGEEAYTSDDGSLQQDVLCAKVPELVKELHENYETSKSAISVASNTIKQFVEQLKNSQPNAEIKGVDLGGYSATPDTTMEGSSVIVDRLSGNMHKDHPVEHCSSTCYEEGRTNEAPLGEELSEQPGPSDSATLPQPVEPGAAGETAS
jgi:hypothetical protein